MADYIDGTGQKIPTGEFVKVMNMRQVEPCNCPKPNSNGGQDFGIHTIWVCLKCGRGWCLEEIKRERRPGAIPVDVWERCESYDILKIKETRQKYKDGDKTYG